jgi:exosome complex component CSL4
MEFREQGIVFPGDSIGCGEEFVAGSGAYLCESSGTVKASLLGQLVCIPATAREENDNKDENDKSMLHVISSSRVSTQDAVIDIGDTVTGRVVRISATQAFVTVLAVGDAALRPGQQPSAVVRKEDIRMADTDSLVVHECFRPGDVVEARVISLGDARQYFLSTAEPEFGVRWARSESSGRLLVALSWKEMQDPVSGAREARKVAKPRVSAV